MTAPFPGALTPTVTPFTPPAGTTLNHGLVPDFVNPLVHQGDVTFEKQLPMNMSFSAAYVVSRALRLPIYVDANLAPATGTRTYHITNLSGATQSTLTEPFYSQRLNPQTGTILAGYSDVNSWYNSMVLSVKKRMSHGFEFLANYTLAKAIDGGQVAGQFGTFFGTDPPLDPLNRKLEYGASDLDQRHRFVGSAVYSPRFKAPNKATDFIANGWDFSTIITLSSGQPLTSDISGFPSGAPDGGLTGGLVTNSGNPSGGRAPSAGATTTTSRICTTWISASGASSRSWNGCGWPWLGKPSICSTTRRSPASAPDRRRTCLTIPPPVRAFVRGIPMAVSCPTEPSRRCRRPQRRF